MSWLDGTLEESIEMLAKHSVAGRELRDAREKVGMTIAVGTSARKKVPKSEFAYRSRSPKGTSKSEARGKYPMPDKAHARSALGFAAMHHGKGSAEYSRVRAKARQLGFLPGKKGNKEAGILETLKETLANATGSDAGKALKGYLDTAKQWSAANPGKAMAIGGAGIGAGIGGLSGLTSRRKDRSALRSAITGGLAGTAIGGGGYLASKYMGGGFSPDAGKGDMSQTGTLGGKKYTLSDKVIRQIRNDPAVAEQFAPTGNPVTSAISGMGRGIANFPGNYIRNHPYLSLLLGADLGTQAVGTAASLAGKPSTQAMHLARGVDRSAAGLKELGKIIPKSETKALKGLRQMTQGHGNTKIREWLQTFNSPQATSAIPGTKSVVSPSFINKVTGAGGGTVRRGGLNDLMFMIRKLRGKPEMGGTFANWSRNLQNSPKRIPRAYSKAFRGAAWANNTFESAANPLTRLMGNTRKGVALARLGPRALLYLGIPAAMAYAGNYGGGAANDRLANVEKLLNKLGK